jgi:hypothetical protein
VGQDRPWCLVCSLRVFFQVSVFLLILCNFISVAQLFVFLYEIRQFHGSLLLILGTSIHTALSELN